MKNSTKKYTTEQIEKSKALLQLLRGNTQKQETNCYVYALLDPRKPGPFTYGTWKFEFETFYIGKGTFRKSGKQRFEDHDEHCTDNTFKANVIAKIKQSGFVDCLRVVKKKNLTSKKSCELEIDMISKIGRRGPKLGPLTNLTNGGDAGFDYLTPEQKEAMYKKRHQTMLNKTEAQKLDIRNKKITTTKNKTLEEKEARGKRISDSWKNMTEEQRNQMRINKSNAQLNRPITEKLETSRKKSVTQLKKTKLQKALIRAKKIKTWANRTPEQNKETSKKRITTLKALSLS